MDTYLSIHSGFFLSYLDDVCRAYCYAKLPTNSIEKTFLFLKIFASYSGTIITVVIIIRVRGMDIDNYWSSVVC